MKTALLLSALLFTSIAVGETKKAEAPAAQKASKEGKMQTAPKTFNVEFETTKGKFTIEVNRDWAPKGADRFYELIQSGFFKDVAFFRVISGFMAQFGIHGDPKVSSGWKTKVIDDDPVKQSNKRGFISYAMAGPNTRTTQFFINFGDNIRLDSMGFSPFGKIDAEGMKIVDQIFSGYGEGAPRGMGPAQHIIHAQGNSYLKEKFPKLDYIKSAKIL